MHVDLQSSCISGLWTGNSWGFEVFHHAACVVTLVDRLIHRAEVIDIEADSYRLKEAKELTAAHAKRRTKKPPAS